MTEQERGSEHADKNVAFYQTFLAAWVENRMEVDKQLLLLSSLAIGLLMIFYDRLETVVEFWLWVVAGIVFVSTIITTLLIFRNNSTYIEQIIKEHDDNLAEKQRLEKSLSFKTTCAFILFIAGVVLTLVLAILKTGFVLMKLKGG